MKIKAISLFLFVVIFCSGYSGRCQSNDQSYALLQAKLDDGYHLVGTDDLLRFKFLEEYNVPDAENKLKFNIYSTEREKQNISQQLTEQFGENLFSLNVSSLDAGKYYILEVFNRKQEKWYLRFKIQ